MTKEEFVEHWDREGTWAYNLKKWVSLLDSLAEGIRWQDQEIIDQCLTCPDFDFQNTLDGPDDTRGMFRLFGEVLDAVDILIALMKERHQATFNVGLCARKGCDDAATHIY